MELLLNDLSLHEQFPDISTFREAIHRVMTLRQVASNWGRELHSHRSIVNARINQTMTLYDALQMFPQNEKRSILQWLTRRGPFWEDISEHNSDQWIECKDEIVTDTAVGEAAYCNSIGISRGLVSLTPSQWERSPIIASVISGTTTDIEFDNYWLKPDLEAALQDLEPPLSSWGQLESVSRTTCRRLTFSGDCFSYLAGQPFAPGAASRILSRLQILDKLMDAVDGAGQRTPEGHQIYQDHFSGDKAWFSDSSDSEKHEFARDLTFPHPRASGGHLFCTWHGKVNNPPYRIHFAWPENPGAPVYIVYVGLKITRR